MFNVIRGFGLSRVDVDEAMVPVAGNGEWADTRLGRLEFDYLLSIPKGVIKSFAFRSYECSFISILFL